MFDQAQRTFRHRNNSDGVIESICSECLMSVGTARVEHGLIQYEIAHVCDPLRVYQLWADPIGRSSSHPKNGGSRLTIRRP
jgi:hypothetical protein